MLSDGLILIFNEGFENIVTIDPVTGCIFEF
jgi:hypothetical protein